MDDLASLVGHYPGHPLVEAVRALIPDLVFTRLFDGVTSAEIAQFVAVAQQNEPDYNPPKFDNSLVAACPDGLNPDILANVPGQWVGLVGYAYVTKMTSDSNIVGTSNPLFVGEGYLGAAPQGIVVQSAWGKGADGSGSRFLDLQQGWFFSHEDLPKPIPLLNGINGPESFAHGAAVLGIIVGRDDN